MRMKKLFVSLLIATITTTAIQAKRTKIKMSDYTVQSGDTLFIIARKHHTTTEEVRKSNGFEYGQLIRVGQKLRVPTNTYFPKEETKRKKLVKKNTKPKKGMTEYTIESGDTLFTIARKHHTTTKEVLEANGLERNAMIRIGQVLKVPTNTYFPEDVKRTEEKKTKIVTNSRKKGKVEYVIEPGDTLFTIARKHHTTTKEVLEANGLERNAMIRIGQVLKVPTNTYFPEDAIRQDGKKVVQKEKKEEPKGIYEVQSGDTLFSIAKKNHVTLKEIMALNDIKAGSLIKVGQKLKVSKKSAFVASKKKKTKKFKIVLKKHKVRRGDTLGKIARKYKTSIKKLRELNHLSKKSILKRGALLVVGEKKIVKKKPSVYRVKKGDTLWLIAKKNHTSVKKLRKLNHLTRRSKLRKGMLLSLKESSSAKKSKKYIAKTKHKTTKQTKIASKSKRSKSKNRRSSDAMALLSGKSRRTSRGSSNVIRTAKRYLGTRYVWGAEGPNRFDCSGFTQYVLRKSKGAKIPRVSRKQAYYGKYVSRRNLRPGDLIFFDTSRRRRGYVNHVGIYIGSNKFIHASSAKHRVVISSLNRPFYNARFKWGRRVN